MSLRSLLDRLFGIGKTANDAARNRQSWQTLLDTIEARAGRAVRDRVHGSPLPIPADGEAKLTVAHRIECGSYLSSAALTGIAALFDEACELQLANEREVQRVLVPTDGPTIPFAAMLDGFAMRLDEALADLDPAVPKHPFAETRAFVAYQFKLGLQEEVADCLRREPATLQATLASCAHEIDELRTPEQRNRWLRDFDARLAAPPPAGPDNKRSGMVTTDKARAIAAALSQWRRNELAQALDCNADAIAQERARLARVDAEARALDCTFRCDGAIAPPYGGANAGVGELPDGISFSPTMAELLAHRTALLAELKSRELSDAIRRCDHYLSMRTDDDGMSYWHARRDALVAQWQRDDLAVQKERDQIRREHVQTLRCHVRSEVDEYTAQGVRLDEEAVLGIVSRVLSRPSFLRQFVATRNLQFLQDIAHGADRAEQIARLVRVCDSAMREDPARGQLDTGDFGWLAAALEAGERHVIVLDMAPPRHGMGRLLGTKRQHWPVSQICDTVAASLDAYAERRRHAAQQWQVSSASLEARWRAGVDALRDSLRTQELQLEDLAVVAFPAFQPLLHAHHAMMAERQKPRREAEQRIVELRALYPQLAGWKADLPIDADPPTLCGMADQAIMGPLMNAYSMTLESARQQLVDTQKRRLAAIAADHRNRSSARRALPAPAAQLLDGGVSGSDAAAAPPVPPCRALQQPGGRPQHQCPTTACDLALEPSMAEVFERQIDSAERRSAADMIEARRRIEQRLRTTLNGTGSSRGPLHAVCEVLEEFASLWRCCPDLALGAARDAAFARRVRSLQKALPTTAAAIASIRCYALQSPQGCVGLPGEAARRVQAELQQARHAVDALERSLIWVRMQLCERSTQPGPSAMDTGMPDHNRDVAANLVRHDGTDTVAGGTPRAMRPLQSYTFLYAAAKEHRRRWKLLPWR